jgi:hypothetical protein
MNPVILIVCCLVLIGAGVGIYFLITPTASTSTTTGSGTSGGTTDTTTTHTTTYPQAEINAWDGNASGAYTCAGAVNRNVSGNGGDFNNYCIFDKAVDAETQCTKDANCLGYVYGGNFFQLVNKAPVKGGGTYFKKTTT